MTWNARSQTLTFWEGSTGSGWLVDGAENSGLTQSTLSTWRRRNLQPNVTSIEKICHGLGITLSQFFEEDAAIHHLTEEQKSLLTTWDRLSPSQRTAILDLIQAFLPE